MADRDSSAWKLRGRSVAGLVVVMLSLGVPLALASHQFTDVPDSSPFHSAIAGVKDAGITSGKTCSPPGTPPTYCPSESITREAMAAFVHRGFARADDNTTPISGPPSVVLTTSSQEVGSVTIQVGGAPGGTQNVVIDAQILARIPSSSGCPCSSVYEIRQNDSTVVSSQSWLVLSAIAPYAPFIPLAPRGWASGAVSAVVAVPTASTQKFSVSGRRPPGETTGEVRASGFINAITAPLAAG